VFETELIVLKKTLYKESSWIINGFSVDTGRFDLMLKGGAKNTAKKFPVIDLFREVRVQYKDGDSDLHTVYNAELVNQFDALANNSDYFTAACEMSAFLIKNTKPELPCPNTYYAWRNILAFYAGNEAFFETDIPSWDVAQSRIILLTCFLEENGLMPENLGQTYEEDLKQRYLLNIIIEAGAEGTPLPRVKPGFWKQLLDWLNALCRYNNLT
jgi:Recombination protein O N terminal